jgi:hypothetical protein
MKTTTPFEMMGVVVLGFTWKPNKVQDPRQVCCTWKYIILYNVEMRGGALYPCRMHSMFKLILKEV